MFHCGPFFLVFLTKCLWNYPSCKKNLPCPEKFMFACMHSGIITFAKRFILNVWQCFEYVSVSIAFLCLLSILNSNLMLCTASETFRILAYSKPCVFRDMLAYSSIFSIIEAYSGLFRHIHHPVWPLRIHNLAIFRATTYLEPEAYSKPCEILTRHIQNSAIVRTVYSSITLPYSGVFSINVVGTPSPHFRDWEWGSRGGFRIFPIKREGLLLKKRMGGRGIIN